MSLYSYLNNNGGIMRNILIVCEGTVGENFIKNIMNLKNVYHNYIVVTQNKEFQKQNYNAENITFYYFDPTSIERLKLIIYGVCYDRFMIAIQDQFEASVVYKNLREIDKEIGIYLVDFWGMSTKFNDKFLKIIDNISMITSRLIGFLPDHPVLADIIGLGKGEIMEVKVPIGSSFAYKKIGMFHQNKFHIPLIYRQNNYIVTNQNTTIMPNDSLLLTGESSTLRNIFTAIKKEKGQFPSPFGINIYVVIDMSYKDIAKNRNLLKTAIFLNDIFKNHSLFIKVINPTFNTLLDEIKILNTKNNCEVYIDYNNTSATFMLEDVKRLNIGFVITLNEFFEKNKDKFYKMLIPVMTMGEGDIANVKRGVVLADDKNGEGESSIVFDVCSQIGIDVYLYYFDQNVSKNRGIIAHYKELSELFKKDLYILDDENQNPIKALEKDENFIHFVSFGQEVLKRSFSNNFARNLDSLYYKLEKNYQIFIPNSYEI